MKFKLKQPTRYMHQNLEQFNEKESSQNQSQNQNKQLNQKNQNSLKLKETYKNRKIIKKKNQPSALRLNKINQTFQNIYKNSNILFHQLQIDHQKLDKVNKITQKNKCKCNKNVKYYCLKCMEKVCKEQFPKVQLPLKVVVIHHQLEKVNKSSALPLKFLTQQISFHFYSNEQHKNQKLWKQLPKPGNNTYILFPHKDSQTINQITSFNILRNNKNNHNSNKIDYLIILDCTWFQTDLLVEAMQKKGYDNYIRIQGYKSLYWRYNHHNDEALCSAEAITFFMREYQKSLLQQIKKTQNQNQIKFNTKKYDNLLFLYSLNLKIIMKQEQIRIEKTNKQIKFQNKKKD